MEEPPNGISIYVVTVYNCYFIFGLPDDLVDSINLAYEIVGQFEVYDKLMGSAAIAVSIGNPFGLMFACVFQTKKIQFCGILPISVHAIV